MSGALSGYGGMQGLGANGLGYYSQLMNSPQFHEMMNSPLYRGLMGAQPAAMGAGGTSLPALGGGAMGGGLTSGGAAGNMSPLTMLLAMQLLRQNGSNLALAPPPSSMGGGQQQGQGGMLAGSNLGGLGNLQQLMQMYAQTNNPNAMVQGGSGGGPAVPSA